MPFLNDGDPVSTWPDSSGNGHNATQTGSARPIFKTNILNGKPVVRFTSAGLSGLIVSPAVSSVLPWTVFVVMKPVSSGVHAVALASSGGSTPVTMGFYGALSVFFVGNRTTYGQNQILPDVSVFHVFTGDSTIQWASDGVGAGLTISSLAASGDFDRIGLWPTLFSDCDIAEIVFCNQFLGTTDRQNAEKTLSVKYGTPAPPAGSVINLATLPGLTGWWKADVVPTTDVSASAAGSSTCAGNAATIRGSLASSVGSGAAAVADAVLRTATVNSIGLGTSSAIASILQTCATNVVGAGTALALSNTIVMTVYTASGSAISTALVCSFWGTSGNASGVATVLFYVINIGTRNLLRIDILVVSEMPQQINIVTP